jgi:hypothetical protein
MEREFHGPAKAQVICHYLPQDGSCRKGNLLLQSSINSEMSGFDTPYQKNKLAWFSSLWAIGEKVRDHKHVHIGKIGTPCKAQ